MLTCALIVWILQPVNWNEEIIRDTFLTTYNLLLLCKKNKIGKFYFASSSAVYGDHGTKPITEDLGPLMPISNYGAMKLASEAICFSAYESWLDDLRIFRFPNVVGTPATHGVILDFIEKLKNSPNSLSVLGNGSQEKSYLHVPAWKFRNSISCFLVWVSESHRLGKILARCESLCHIFP